MTTPPIVMRKFGGIRPRVPAALLQDPDATTAWNCDLGYGELRNTNDGQQITQLSNVAQSIYTDDGIVFFSWPGDVNAARSPIAQDPYNRLYYTSGSDCRVASRDLMKTSGGEPSASYRVGVPRPTTAPTLRAVAAPVPANQNWTCIFFYESAGTKYQVGNVPLQATSSPTSWTFPATAIASTTPSSAVPQVELIGANANTGVQEFDDYSSSSSFTGTAANTADWTVTLTFTGMVGTVSIAASAQQGANQETLAYTYTYVNIYGEEGPPSDPALVTHEIGLEVDVTVNLDAFTADYAPINEIRIYRTPSGSAVASYFYTSSILPLVSGGGPKFTLKDTIPAASLAEQLTSLNYYAPPPALIGISQLPNGILFGWLDNALYFSEAYKPWAWNPANVLTFPNRIVGAMPMGSGLVLSTTAKPFVVSGVTPDAMSAAPLNITQAGVSKWSFANVGGQVLYASQEGIVMIMGAMGSLNYSDQFFTRDVWKKKYAPGLPHMRFAAWDGRLVVWADNNAFTPFMIRFEESGGNMTELPLLFAQGSFVSPISDSLYYTLGNSVYQFNAGVPLQSTWISRMIELPHPTNFGAAEVLCSGTWTFGIWADNGDGVPVERYQISVTGDMRFRLPGGYKSRRWQVSAQGTGVFKEVRIAESMREIGDI